MRLFPGGVWRHVGARRAFCVTLLSLCLLGALTGCTNNPADPQSLNPIAPPSRPLDAAMKEITLTTEDGWTIVGDLYTPAEVSHGAVILLHQRKGSAKDWSPLCLALQKVGYTALALDQRGAGRSLKGPGPTGDNAPWPTSGDIAAAVAYLKPTAKKNIGLAGASYGANNALIYAAAHPEQIRAVALFSPGENYNGLDAVAAARSYTGPLLIFHARNDTIAGTGPQTIRDESVSGDKDLREIDDNVHGTELLSRSIDETVAFFQRLLQ